MLLNSRILKFMTLAIVLSLFSGCGAFHRGGSQPVNTFSAKGRNPLVAALSWRNPLAPRFDRACDVTVGGDAFHCLQEACSTGGGSWDAQAKQCFCPRGYYFSGTVEPAFQCVGLKFEEGKGPAFFSAAESPVNLLQISDDDFKRLWGDDVDHLDVRIGRNMSIAPLFFTTAGLKGARAEIALRDQLQAPFRARFDEYQTLALVDDLKEVGELYGARPSNNSTAVPHAMAPKGEMETAIAGIMSYYAGNKNAILDSAKVSFVSRFGCLDRCQLESDFNFNGWMAAFRRTYLYGLPVRTQILISLAQSPARIDAVLQLDSLDRLNLIFERASARKNGQLSLHTRVLDRSFAEVASFDDLLIKDFDSLVASMESAQAKPADRGTVIVCEDGLNLNLDLFPFGLPSLVNVLRFGPYRSSDPDGKGSLLGWFANSESSRQRFLSGLENSLVDDGRDNSSELSNDAADHAREMISAITFKQEDKLSVIPMRFSDCTERFAEWTKAMPADRAPRIINVSMGEDRMDSHVCERSSWQSAIDASVDSHLWILATPNERISVKEALHCPTSLTGRESVLVVTPHALDDSARIDERHAYGSEIVDLAVDGHSIEGGVSGSSAAARTSQLAALIARAHPNLKPKDIKRALMMGVDATGVDVRARGTLNPAKAVIAGDVLAEADSRGIALTDGNLKKELSKRVNQKTTNSVPIPSARE